MRRPGLRAFLLTFGALTPSPGGGAAEPQPAVAEFQVEPITERIVTRLPEGPLHWRIETFPSLAAARAVAGPLALAAGHNGRAWLFTLGPSGGATPGGTRVAEIGPVPVVPARRYLLRVNRAGGPPGAATPVHAHPGSEAFYVLAGELSQRTPHGTVRIEAGQAMNGHGAGMAMQLTSSGAAALDQLVLFVVDADLPFSAPAVLE